MISRQGLSLKRINKDLKEITESPIEGIGIASIDNNPMEYVVNMRLMSGIYIGYCIQLLLLFSDEYPSRPPKILIFPGQLFGEEYHHHIFTDFLKDENNLNYKKFCFDLLDNDFMSTSEEKTGWNPSYSISTILLQVQNFLCNPDLPENLLPDKNKIEKLIKSMDNYQKIFIIEEGNKKIEKIHTWKNPYPEMFFKKNENKNVNKNNENIKIKIIKDNLTCFMLKLNYIDDSDILLGYPIIKKNGKSKDEYELYPIPELVSYDGFMSQINNNHEKLDNYYQTVFKSANNEYYNYWIPIYINNNHYEKNKTTILNSFSIIKYGNKGIKKYDFKIEQIFEILPKILNKMIIHIFSEENISSAIIRCIFHLVLLFRKLSEEFEEKYIKYLNHILNKIHINNYIINKSIIPDLGDFFILLYFWGSNIHNEKRKKIWKALFEEFLARQMNLILKDLDYFPEIFKKLSIKKQKYIKNNINSIKEDIMIKILQKGYLFGNLRIDNNISCAINENALINNLKNNGNYNKVLNLIFSLQNEKLSMKQQNNENDNKDNNLINLLKESSKEIIYKFYKLYYPNKNQEIDFFLSVIFSCQKENKLLLTIFLVQKKINEKGFMEELENNYGIFLEVDNFIKLMKQKINEIKTYKGLFEFIGSEIGKNDDEIEIILKAYNKAKKKGYLNKLFE